MRILYSHRIQSRDGQSVHVEEIVAALREAGHEVMVVGPGFYDQASFGGESRTVAALRRLLPGGLHEIAELAYNVPAYWRLRRACRKFRPDFLYERYNLLYIAGALYAKRHRLLYYVEVNSPLGEERSRFGNLRLQGFANVLEAFVWRSADRVLAVTGVLKEKLVQRRVAAERIMVVPNGIDVARYDLQVSPTEGNANSIVLGFAGFIRSWHGLDAVIRAMAEDRDAASVRLRVVGEGPAKPALEALCAETGLSERVSFLGLADRDSIPHLLAEFDIALQPKSVGYASPLKIFEYMAAGCAIVAPDQANIREILIHDRTALLFDPADPDGMWAAVRRLIADPALRAKLGKAARAEINQRDYTWRGNARRIVDWAKADLSKSSPADGVTDGRSRQRESLASQRGFAAPGAP